jgi:hypothetical protein
MKKWFVSIFCLLDLLSAGAQNLMLTGDNLQVVGRQVDRNSWYFESGDSVMILMNMADFNQLITEIRYLQADTAMNLKIIEANNELIEKFENYQGKADSHIVIQEKLIDTVDSLYTRYRGLYTDLKKIYATQKFSLIPGIGLVDLPAEDRRAFIGSVGIEYNKWQGHFQLGKNYKAVVVGLRFPIF